LAVLLDGVFAGLFPGGNVFSGAFYAFAKAEPSWHGASTTPANEGPFFTLLGVRALWLLCSSAGALQGVWVRGSSRSLFVNDLGGLLTGEHR
jgi:hypothetical protein